MSRREQNEQKPDLLNSKAILPAAIAYLCIRSTFGETSGIRLIADIVTALVVIKFIIAPLLRNQLPSPRAATNQSELVASSILSTRPSSSSSSAPSSSTPSLSSTQ